MTKVALDAAATNKEETSGLKWLAESCDTYGRSALGASLTEERVQLYERARELAPGDLDALRGLAEAYAAAGKPTKAIKACDEMLALLERGATPPPGWSRARVLVFIAERQRDGGGPDAATATLIKIDLPKTEMPAWLMWRTGHFWEALGNPDRAARYVARVVEDGYRPYIRLAELYLKAENWVEAMRSVNRATALGWDGYVREPSFWAPTPFESKETPDTLRAAVYRKAGRDYFIDRLLLSALPELTAEEGREAREALENLRREHLADREKAVDVLRRLGPKCARVLAPSLKSSNLELQQRVRGLLNAWAEPR